MPMAPRPTSPVPNDRRPPRLGIGLGLGLLILGIGTLDAVTGHELRLFLLYFLPVSLAGWLLGRRQGLVTAFAAAVAWTVADVLSGHEYGEPAHQFVNAIVQFLTFAFVAILLARASAGLRTERALSARLAEEKVRVERLNAATAEDLELAGRVQRTILPAASPQVPGLDVAVTYRPAIQVGGDVVDLYRVDANRTLFLLGDAMGHGVHAALVMSALSVLARRIVAERADPAGLLAELNTALLADFPDQLVTGVACLVDVEAATATLAVAGHPPPHLVRSADGRVEEVGEGSAALGLLSESRYRSSSVSLRPGDGLVLVTDGVLEAVDRARDRYGEDRLLEVLQRSGGKDARGLTVGILEDVAAFCQGVPFADDVAILVVRKP